MCVIFLCWYNRIYKTGNIYMETHLLISLYLKVDIQDWASLAEESLTLFHYIEENWKVY